MGLGEGPVEGTSRERSFRLVLEYDGSGFLGWQVQSEGRTVQGEVEAALARVLGRNVRVVGAGRTDRGVHALGQTASFRVSTPRSVAEIRGALGALLPPDVVVREVEEARDGFDARRDAIARRYLYRIQLGTTALDRDRSWTVPGPLRTGRMRSALPALLGEHDFAPFTVCLAEQAGTQAVVYGAALRRRGATLEFEIESNRFLRRMVRALTGALVDIGRGRLEPDLFRRVLDGGEPAPPFPMAPPQGLYLVAVTYEDGPVGEARSARRRR